MSLDFERHARQIERLCRKFRVLRLEAFGSAVKEHFDPSSSDVDLIAEFAATREPGYADRYYEFSQSLETLFGRPVDLLTPGALRNPRFAESIRHDAVTLYDSKEHQAA